MTTVDTSGKIVTSIMTLELIESPETIFTFGVFTGADPGFLKRVFICIKARGSLFRFYLIFFKYPMKMK